MINTATNTVSSTTSVGSPGTINPSGVAVSPDGSEVFVSAGGTCCNDLQVIATATDTLTTSINIGSNPNLYGVAFTPDGSKAYVARYNLGDVVVINTATNAVTGTIPIGGPNVLPVGVAVSPDGTRLYVANLNLSSVSVIDTATNTVIGTILTPGPFGISITPDGSRLYVANNQANAVSVIDTGSNNVLGTIFVGSNPIAFGTFIQSLPSFAGTPGAQGCHSASVSALANKFGGLNAAAAAFGFAKVQGLQDASRTFCGS